MAINCYSAEFSTKHYLPTFKHRSAHAHTHTIKQKLETVEKEMEMIAIEKKKMAMKLKVAEVAIKKLTPVEIATISKSMQDCELEN